MRQLKPTDNQRLMRACNERYATYGFYEWVVDGESSESRSSLRLDISVHNLSSVSFASSSLVSIWSSCVMDGVITTPSTGNDGTYPPADFAGISANDNDRRLEEHSPFVTPNRSMQGIH